MMKSKKESVKKTDFLIVGIGASAGGLEAFKEFFSAMPEKNGMAFVLIQHLDPTHKSMLTELIRKFTKMIVTEVTDGLVVKPDNVYVIPPNKEMAILDGKLHLLDPIEARGFRRPIDYFLESLSKDRKENAVGIILSGTGTEGAISLKSIRGEGGLSIVQDPTTAKYDGMPRSAVAAGVADYILPVKEIPAKLISYDKLRKIELFKEDVVAEPSNGLLEKIFILLRNATGCNFNNYKKNTIIRRIEKRMAMNHIHKLEDYVKYLRIKPEEVNNLYGELLIGVTSFFRDKEVFEHLNEKAISKIVKNKTNGDTIRVWVPACSTGEEAYSIAILFDEAIRKFKKNLSLQLFASDIDEKAVKIARMGLYPDSITTSVNDERIKRYFQSEVNAFRIKKEIRDRIVFAEQNVINDPPFSKLDLISCRNLLIYLNTETQQKLFTLFHYALNANGILFLGNSESLGESSDLFTSLDRKSKIFLKKSIKLDSYNDLNFILEPRQVNLKTAVKLGDANYVKNSLGELIAGLLLTKYAPACVIINRVGEAVYFSGDTGKYLQHSPGKASLNIIDMASEGLKSILRSLIAKARKDNSPQERKGAQIKTNKKTQVIDLSVTPITQFEPDQNYVMVTFEDQLPLATKKSSVGVKVIEDASEIQALEQELDSTKEYLRSTIEELEVSNEELKSSNEELQSSNEELQSTNEEMETSKEELQSINEEMITVNNELQQKMEELSHSNNDMSNLLANTKIGMVFLDRDLKIRRYTPSATKIINVIVTDIGRPITNLSTNIKYDNLGKDAESVLENLTPIQVLAAGLDNSWYQVKIVPYITSENVVEGVVLTFVDITTERQNLIDLRTGENNYNDLLRHTKTSLFKQDKKLLYVEQFNSPFNTEGKDFIGKGDKELLSDKDEVKILEKLKRNVIKTGVPTRNEVTMTFNGIVNYYDLIIRPWLNEKSEIVGVVCTATNISELNQAMSELAIMHKKK